MKAFDAVKKDIIKFVYEQYEKYPGRFTSTIDELQFFNDENGKLIWSNHYIHEIKDLHTPGKVSSALGIPMYKLTPNKYTMPNRDVVEISTKQIKESLENFKKFVHNAFVMTDDV